MAKEQRNGRLTNGRLTWVLVFSVIGLALTIGGVIWASAQGYGAIATEQANHSEAIKTVKGEGCLPARSNQGDILTLQNDVDHIKDDVADIRREQTMAFKEILERLPE